MSTKSTGLKGAPLFVRVLLLLLLLILILLLVAYAALRSVPPEALRQLLGVTTTPSATAIVSAPGTPTLPTTPSPTSTPLVIVGTVPIEETVTPVSPVTATGTVVPTPTPAAVVVVPSPTRPGTATPTLIALTIVPSPTATRPATPTATPTSLRPVVTPSASPVGAEVGIVAEEVSPTVTATATPLPTPTVPPLIVPRVTIAEVIRNGDFSGEFMRGGVASEWEVFHNGAATFWCYPDTLRTMTGEVLRSQTLHIHGADLSDRYLGIYQTVDVVPGGVYTFTIAGLVRTPQGDVRQTGYGYRMQVGFDLRGGSNWQDVESWIELPWDEQSRDRPSYRVDVFTTSVTARQPQLTVFIRAWKKWADAGEGMYDITRVSLVGPVVTMAPQAPTAIVPPTLPPGVTPLAAVTPSPLPSGATPVPPTTPVTPPTLPSGVTPPTVVVPTPLPPGATPVPPTLVVPLTPTPEITALAVPELPPPAVTPPTPAVPVTGDALLTLWDAQRTVITALLVALLLLGGMLYRWRPRSPR